MSNIPILVFNDDYDGDDYDDGDEMCSVSYITPVAKYFKSHQVQVRSNSLSREFNDGGGGDDDGMCSSPVGYSHDVIVTACRRECYKGQSAVSNCRRPRHCVWQEAERG